MVPRGSLQLTPGDWQVVTVSEPPFGAKKKQTIPQITCRLWFGDLCTMIALVSLIARPDQGLSYGARARFVAVLGVLCLKEAPDKIDREVGWGHPVGDGCGSICYLRSSQRPRVPDPERSACPSEEPRQAHLH